MASFVLPIISGLAGLFGGGKQQTQQGNFSGSQTGSTTGTTSQSGSSTSSPNFSPFQTQLMNLFGSGLTKQLAGTDLTGYSEQGLEGINNSSNAQSNIMKQILASKGLQYSPTGAFSQSMGEQNRLNQSNQFLAGVPLLQRQLQSNALQQLIQGFSAVPTGSTSTSSGSANTSGTSSSSSTGSQSGSISGNPWAGLISGFGAGLAAPSGGTSNLGNILGMFGYGQGNTSVPGYSGAGSGAGMGINAGG